MSKDDLLFEMARAMVRANQAEWDKPAADWTADELEADRFYSAAREAHDAILAAGFVIYPRKPPPQDILDAVADAVRKTFSPYRKITPAKAAVELLTNLGESQYQVRKVVSLPR